MNTTITISAADPQIKEIKERLSSLRGHRQDQIWIDLPLGSKSLDHTWEKTESELE